MQKYFPLLWLGMLLPALTSAQEIIQVWPDGVPDCPIASTYRVEQDKNIGRKTLSVQEPTLEVYQPPAYRANGAAVLICPGGGYYLQAYDWEGVEFAKWFNQHGITAFVLKYRLPYWSEGDCKEHVALDDAKQAMRLIRNEAPKWQVDSDRIGVMGFSAGGHLAATLSTLYNAGPVSLSAEPIITCRPDFSLLIYPVISGDTSISHTGSFKNLLGQNPAQEKVLQYSAEKHVDEHTPPAFLIHAADDKGVPFANSIAYFQALQAHGVPSALHIFSRGGHGFALAEKDPYLHTWLDLMAEWIEIQGFMEK
ncbi:MAG: alpha/beta hydrolase [Bacteroidota bacterium]